MGKQKVIARFEAERQTLPIMDHPNIAKVLDVGTTQAHGLKSVGLGIPITVYCDQCHLTTRERLDLSLTS